MALHTVAIYSLLDHIRILQQLSAPPSQTLEFLEAFENSGEQGGGRHVICACVRPCKIERGIGVAIYSTIRKISNGIIKVTNMEAATM